MDNIGMFSDVYPACPFPRSFSYQIKKTEEPTKAAPSLPDSTEDIQYKMFESPERDSEDFERSLKKTMECIAQVCDTTVPDTAHDPESPLKPLKPHLDQMPRPHLDIPHHKLRESLGPITNKRHGTPPQHPYSKPSSRRTLAKSDVHQHREESIHRQVFHENYQLPDEVTKRGHPTKNDQLRQLPHIPPNQFPPSYTPSRPPPPSNSPEDQPPSWNHPEPLDPYKGQRLPPYGEASRPPYGEESRPPLPEDVFKKQNPNPEHFIFPDCTSDLQKEFFMFYMQKCLEKSNMNMPLSSHPMIPVSPQISSVQTSEKRFVDSTTSPINPSFLEVDNKENMNPTLTPVQDSCQYSSPPNDLQDIKPQRLHFDFPSPLPQTTSPDQDPQPPISTQISAKTPNPITPIMGPSLDAASVLGPSYHRPQPFPHQPFPSQPARPNYPPQYQRVDPQGPEPFRHRSDHPEHRQRTAGPTDPKPDHLIPEPFRPRLEQSAPSELYRQRDEHPGSFRPSFQVPQQRHQVPFPTSRPPNLPLHLFPDSRKLQFTLPQPKPASDKAIPDNLAAGYMGPGDLANTMLPFTPEQPKSGGFKFRETVGKMLSKKKISMASESLNPTGKRTKFSNEQLQLLEHFYHNVGRYVTGSNKTKLCQMTGLELNTILMWFQNRRAREKKRR